MKLITRASRVAASTAVALSLFAFATPVMADIDPVGCFSTGGSVSLTTYRADGITPIGAGTVTDGELINYQATIAALASPVCAFEFGTWTLTTPDGVVHVITPGGGIPRIGGTGVASLDSALVPYTVIHANELVNGNRHVDATTLYSGGISHRNGDDSLLGPTLGTSGQAFVVHTPTVTTNIHNAQHVATTSVPLGESVHDNAVVAFTGGPTPTGSVAFNLYANSSCTGATTTQTVALVAGVAESNSTTAPSSGMSYMVHYNGDDNFVATDGICEPLTVILPKGHIIVDKVTVPSGDPTSFAFTTTGTGYTGFSLTDAATPNDQTLDAGSYSVTETPNSNYTTELACLSTDLTDVSSPSAITLNAGETITCTFTNTRNQGTIELKKVWSGTGGQTTLNIGTSIGGSQVDTQLTGAAGATPLTTGPNTVNTGTYYNSETGGLTNYTTGALVCFNDANNNGSNDGESAVTVGANDSVVVATGQHVICTYTNTLNMGHIIVNKVTNPSGSSQSFAFTTTGTGYTGFSLTDTATPNDQSVVPGAYTVSEGAVAGWSSDGGSCDNGETPASLDVGPGETVTCTFTNTEQKGRLIVQKTTVPAGDLTVFSIMASGTGDITGGGAGSVSDATDQSYEVTPGTYSVSETLPAGWTQTSNTCSGVVVAAGETKTCVIVNTYAAQYCSPGYWKQSQHFDSWKDYLPTDTFSSVFGESVTIMWSAKGKPAPVTDPTLLQVLEANGGGASSLARAAVGALLNASALDSGLTTVEVIAIFNAAYPDGDFEAAKALYTFEHNCPLN